MILLCLSAATIFSVMILKSLSKVALRIRAKPTILWYQLTWLNINIHDKAVIIQQIRWDLYDSINFKQFKQFNSQPLYQRISQDDFKQNQYKSVVRVTAFVFTIFFLYCIKFIWSLCRCNNKSCWWHYYIGRTDYIFTTVWEWKSLHACDANSIIHICLQWFLKVWSLNIISWLLNATYNILDVKSWMLMLLHVNVVSALSHNKLQRCSSNYVPTCFLHTVHWINAHIAFSFTCELYAYVF